MNPTSTPPAVPSPRPIERIAASLGLQPGDVEPYGWFKGKLALGLEKRLADRPAGAYVGVSAVSPTPPGEGKTVTAIGLAMGLCREGHRAVVTLREPSLAPVFGIKGGGTGGGKAFLMPSEDINFHFTGDIHAVGAANNLLAALIDNHIKRGLSPPLDPLSVTWRRAVDINDKGLSSMVTGLGNTPMAPLRETGFELTAASEMMAILALATGLDDLRQRLNRIVVGLTPSGDPVSVEDLGCGGALTALLRDAVRPNLVQTCEHTPALVHAGPFGNIAHGNCSILADLAAVRLADYVITESGFGADCGAEKFFDIKCRAGGLRPSAEVLVCSVRALKYQSGRFRVRPGVALPEDLFAENLHALHEGAANLQAHLDIIRQFGLPIVVAVNRFPTDTDRELDEVSRLALENGAASVAVSDVYARGGEGAGDLARAVISACKRPASFQFLYPLEMPLDEKIRVIARRIYGADDVDYEPPARRRLARYRDLGFNDLPVCIAKTPYSLSHDPQLLGRPTGFRVPIQDVRLAAGAGFVYALAGPISTMPGMPSRPRALDIGVDDDGNITGLDHS